MQRDLQKKIKEATYLTADKAWSYRPILRYFYIQHERMREFLYPEAIYEHLRHFVEFQEYTMDMLHQDLDSLTKWGNIIATQEHRKARTIEEYKKKNFRYQCTPYTVEFERMMIQLEQLGDSFGGSLEKTQFERLYQVLEKIGQISDQTDAECAQLWDDAMEYFRKITQNTSDYIAYIHSEKVIEKMKTEEFLVYKDRFTTYLRDFIIALQQTAMQIQDVLTELTIKQIEPFLQQVMNHQHQTFRLEEDQKDVNIDLIEKWQNLRGWFLGTIHGESEFERLQERTDEAIRRITRMVQRMSERHQQFRSRRRDYEHLATWFDGIETIEEAHRLSSVIFGVFHTRHLYGEQVPTDDMYVDVWEEAPMRHETKPRTTKYKESTKAGVIIDRSEQIAEMRQLYLNQLEKERESIERYIEEGIISIKALPIIEPHVRKLLLSWLGKAMVREDRIVKTEYGRRVRVMLEEERVFLRATDGSLEMPNVEYHFIDEEVTS
ncbi:TIGR02677 family protein [Exiguobacterium qingdaonense]|uniref:TIGR02677 family protein n=1 Tax=Exiguobacterium qingdaonense TaxID=2751251 RepID=UPI001BE58FBB|nr:TIGR02677 family protein [Exiguobacterium qingdaonense]